MRRMLGRPKLTVVQDPDDTADDVRVGWSITS